MDVGGCCCAGVEVHGGAAGSRGTRALAPCEQRAGMSPGGPQLLQDRFCWDCPSLLTLLTQAVSLPRLDLHSPGFGVRLPLLSFCFTQMRAVPPSPLLADQWHGTHPGPSDRVGSDGLGGPQESGAAVSPRGRAPCRGGAQEAPQWAAVRGGPGRLVAMRSSGSGPAWGSRGGRASCGRQVHC